MEKQYSENNRAALYEAIKIGNIALAETCLKKITPEEIRENSDALLRTAIETEQLESVKLLMQYGAEITLDALSLAHDQGRKKDWNNALVIPKTIFGLFLETNTLTFNPDIGFGYLYLLTTIKEGHVETIKRSLGTVNVADTKIFNKRDFRFECTSIIEWAIYHRRTEIANLLLDFYQTHKNALQANYIVYNEHQFFYYAVRHENLKIAERLLNSPHVQLDQDQQDSDPPNATGSPKPSNPAALYYAAVNKSQAMARLLLEAGATYGTHVYSSTQLEFINGFKTEITTLYNMRLQCARKELESNLPCDLIDNIVLPYVFSDPHANIDESSKKVVNK